MKLASDSRWPAIRSDAIETRSAALFSAWVRALASAIISGTIAMVMPATRITAANLSENDAPRQTPPSHRTPRIARQLDRRTSARETIAIVAATRTVESAI